MIEATITKSATTFTIGSSAGRARVAKIQIGSVCSAPDVKMVTTTSSNESANDEQPTCEERRAELREHDVAEGLPVVGAQVGGGLVERAGRATGPGDDVVVDHHHAEGRVADDDRRQTERDAERAEHVDDRRLQRKPGHDPGQRDREDHGEGDHLATEEAVARNRERRERPEHERDGSRAERRDDGEQQRLANCLVLERDPEPARAELLDRPLLRHVPVERVEPDDGERHVEERERRERAETEEKARETGLGHSDSKAFRRRASRR